MLTQAVLFCFLIWGTWWDVKERAFPSVGLAVFGLAGFMAQLIERGISVWNIAGGMLIGAVILGISLLYPEEIGDGDGIFLMVTGLLLGFWGNIMLLFGSLLLAAGFGLLCAAAGRSLRRLRVPLAPFALAAGLGMAVF